MPASITTARRAREFAAREELILREARKFLLERGFQGWNMDDLAKAVEYSKGTLYQHFESKEDLALAVCTGSLQQRSDLFEKASQFKGGTRERIRAICCARVKGRPWVRGGMVATRRGVGDFELVHKVGCKRIRKPIGQPAKVDCDRWD